VSPTLCGKRLNTSSDAKPVAAWKQWEQLWRAAAEARRGGVAVLRKTLAKTVVKMSSWKPRSARCSTLGAFGWCRRATVGVSAACVEASDGSDSVGARGLLPDEIDSISTSPRRDRFDIYVYQWPLLLVNAAGPPSSLLINPPFLLQKVNGVISPNSVSSLLLVLLSVLSINLVLLPVVLLNCKLSYPDGNWLITLCQTSLCLITLCRQ
jgi:hypothetical protein